VQVAVGLDGLVDQGLAGLVNLAWLFSPDVIVIGGGLGLAGDVLLDPLRQAVQSYGPPAMVPPIAILPAALGDDAGLAGAAAWAKAFRPEAAGRPTPAPPAS
jgi:glucokinase